MGIQDGMGIQDEMGIQAGMGIEDGIGNTRWNGKNEMIRGTLDHPMLIVLPKHGDSASCHYKIKNLYERSQRKTKLPSLSHITLNPNGL